MSRDDLYLTLQSTHLTTKIGEFEYACFDYRFNT
jgi:hypothetical protein